ncbi:hypothetical protein [Nostoc favosum]|uniref:Uncharacterized protein n=1 Tax=Nostoc favosum CHAB5714 TaxID=2780399 RepID=A0ABS8I9F7_9NOSO|nr:hypothetical protein [Nostoc favosum]MCC5600818.1 hypothetical protein [Nostoc favosum CHAB5714]
MTKTGSREWACRERSRTGVASSVVQQERQGTVGSIHATVFKQIVA